MPDGRTNLLRREQFRNPVGPAQPPQAGRGQNDGVIETLIELAQPRVQIPSNVLDHEIRPQPPQLRGAAQRAGADARAGFEIGQFAAHQGVEGKLALGDRRHGQARGQERGQVLQAVHRQVDAPIQQRLFDLLREEAFGAHLGERHVSDLVARGADDFEARLEAESVQAAGDVARLPERQLRAAGTDDQGRGHAVWSSLFSIA